MDRVALEPDDRGRGDEPVFGIGHRQRPALAGARSPGLGKGMKMVSGEERCLDVLENARQIERFFASAIDGQLIAGIGMAHDARGGVVP